MSIRGNPFSDSSTLIADARDRYIDGPDITPSISYGLAAKRPQSAEYRTFTYCSFGWYFTPTNAGNPGQVVTMVVQPSLPSVDREETRHAFNSKSSVVRYALAYPVAGRRMPLDEQFNAE